MATESDNKPVWQRDASRKVMAPIVGVQTGPLMDGDEIGIDLYVPTLCGEKSIGFSVSLAGARMLIAEIQAAIAEAESTGNN